MKTMDKKTKMENIAVGDIVHATSSSAPSLICLVIAVTIEAIDVRTITTQKPIRFNRNTGTAKLEGTTTIKCSIDSVEPLPVNFHNIMLGLDRKMRLSGSVGLDEDEKRALLFVHSHYRSNPL